MMEAKILIEIKHIGFWNNYQNISGGRLTLHYIYSGMPILPPNIKRVITELYKFANLRGMIILGLRIDILLYI